ncbi:MAG TPA: hypothetical protein HA355_03455 [Methanosphaera sp.]|nr:hypothetical protein [Methanosphaera sp.]
MSQQNYPEYGFGLVLSGEEIDNFINRTKVENPYELQEIDEFGGFARYYDEECEGKGFTSISHDYLEDEPMLAFWATHQPDAFKAVYTEESVVKEFKEKIGKYLPDDFNYISHIGYFQCCIYC